MARVLHECMAKGHIAQGTEIRRGWGWLAARRGTLRVTSEALELGDWRIPYAGIQDARLFSIRQFFLPGYVLQVTSGGVTYQFGLNPGRFWQGELPFPVKRETARVLQSPLGLLLRVVLAVIAIGFLLRLARQP